jgi:hypothetical protein
MYIKIFFPIILDILKFVIWAVGVYTTTRVDFCKLHHKALSIWVFFFVRNSIWFYFASLKEGTEHSPKDRF